MSKLLAVPDKLKIKKSHKILKNHWSYETVMILKIIIKNITNSVERWCSQFFIDAQTFQFNFNTFWLLILFFLTEIYRLGPSFFLNYFRSSCSLRIVNFRQRKQLIIVSLWNRDVSIKLIRKQFILNRLFFEVLFRDVLQSSMITFLADPHYYYLIF